jgi:hypothetical protein
LSDTALLQNPIPRINSTPRSTIYCADARKQTAVNLKSADTIAAAAESALTRSIN